MKGSIKKQAYIECWKLEDGRTRCRVFSESGKSLGTYDSKDPKKAREKAEKRIKQVEYFKHQGRHTVAIKLLDLEFKENVNLIEDQAKTDKELLKMLLLVVEHLEENYNVTLLTKEEQYVLGKYIEGDVELEEDKFSETVETIEERINKMKSEATDSLLVKAERKRLTADEIQIILSVFKRLKTLKSLEILSKVGVDVSGYIKDLRAFDKVLYRNPKEYNVMLKKEVAQKAGDVVDKLKLFLDTKGKGNVAKAKELLEKDGYITFDTFKKLFTSLGINYGKLMETVEHEKEKGNLGDKVSLDQIEEFVYKITSAQEAYQKNIDFSHRVVVNTGEKFSTSGKNQRMMTMHYDENLALPTDIDKKELEKHLKGGGYHTRIPNTLAYFRWNEYDLEDPIKKGEGTKKVWLVEEVQSDLMEQPWKEKKRLYGKFLGGDFSKATEKQKADAYKKMDDKTKDQVDKLNRILAYYENWQDVMYNHFVDIAKEAEKEVDYVFITTGQTQHKKWPHASVDWGRFYDRPAEGINAKVTKTKEKLALDRGGYGQGQSEDTFYVTTPKDATYIGVKEEEAPVEEKKEKVERVGPEELTGKRWKDMSKEEQAAYLEISKKVKDGSITPEEAKEEFKSQVSASLREERHVRFPEWLKKAVEEADNPMSKDLVNKEKVNKIASEQTESLLNFYGDDENTKRFAHLSIDVHLQQKIASGEIELEEDEYLVVAAMMEDIIKDNVDIEKEATFDLNASQLRVLPFMQKYITGQKLEGRSREEIRSNIIYNVSFVSDADALDMFDKVYPKD